MHSWNSDPVVLGSGSFVVTGSRVSAMMWRFSFFERARVFRTSMGPKTSRAWKPGKRRTPKVAGIADRVG